MFSVPGQEEALKVLDEVLESYSFFSLLTLVHGDKEKEAADRGLATSADTKTSVTKNYKPFSGNAVK
jgi:hypothetical protein